MIIDERTVNMEKDCFICGDDTSVEKRYVPREGIKCNRCGHWHIVGSDANVLLNGEEPFNRNKLASYLFYNKNHKSCCLYNGGRSEEWEEKFHIDWPESQLVRPENVEAWYSQHPTEKD